TPATVLAGGAAHLGVRSRGAVELLRVPLDGGSPEALVDGPFTVHGLAVAGGVVVATVGHDRSAGELIAVTPGRRRLLTGFGRALGATGRLHRSEERTATAPDGTEVHGWVTLPDGPGPHPVLLSLSDPLHRPEGWSLSVDTQVLVSAGYAVVRCAPRGSPGYGQAHARAVRGAGGTVDADDVAAFLDAVLADPALDPERVGVMGTGYGGWLTTVLTGRTTRFAAAVLDGALTDPAGLVGTSDAGWWFVDQYLGADPPTPAADSTTPTLVVHGEDDRRYPAGQGTRRYVELKPRGVSSELGRTGRPRHRQARLEHLLRWWARWLPVTLEDDLPAEVVDAGALPPDEGGREPLTVRATR